MDNYDPFGPPSPGQGTITQWERVNQKKLKTKDKESLDCCLNLFEFVK